MLAALPDGVTRIVERFPDAQWRGVAPAADDRLSRRARDAFDPHRLLNRGLLGEEAA
jgi:FAD/FMN-containing dehydrogenase